MESILDTLSIGIFIILLILSIYRSIKYGIISHNFWRGLLLFLVFGIIAFGIFASLCGGSITVYGIMGGGDISMRPYLDLLIISSFVYWYGILGFHQKLINQILSIGGFIIFNIALFIFTFRDISELLSAEIDVFISLGGILSISIWGIMLYAIIRIWNSDPIEKRINHVSLETTDLMSSLSQIDISNITSINFIPTNGQGFMIKTQNIKRLAVYITTKLGKTTFEAEELRKPFDYVVKNISSDLSKRDFDLVTGKIEEFVKSGGEVKIEKI